MGEHKGAGLALMMELLTGALAGGLLSQEVLRADSSKQDPNASKFFLALDVEAFVERDRFLQKTEEMLAFLRESMEPGKEVLYPGERGWRIRNRNLTEGIPIHSEIVAALQQIGMPLPSAIS